MRQGDVLSPNLFKLYINDFPKYLQNLPGTVFLNSIPLQCLIYADDIVILSSSREGLQRRLDKLNLFFKEWCLDVNIDKTKIIIFNKNGTLQGRRRRWGRSGERGTTFLADHGIRRTTFFSIAAAVLTCL